MKQSEIRDGVMDPSTKGQALFFIAVAQSFLHVTKQAT
jgi:hypothetical protein